SIDPPKWRDIPVEYRVVWEIDVTAEGPEEAARQAFAAMQDPDTLARHFTVRRPGRRPVRVEVGRPSGELATPAEGRVVEATLTAVDRLFARGWRGHT